MIPDAYMGFDVSITYIVACVFGSTIVAVFAKIIGFLKLIRVKFFLFWFFCFCMMFPSDLSIIRYVIYSINYTLLGGSGSFGHPNDEKTFHYSWNVGAIENWCRYSCIRLFLDGKVHSVSYVDSELRISKIYLDEMNERCSEEIFLDSLAVESEAILNFLNSCFIHEFGIYPNAAFTISYNKINLERGGVFESIIKHNKSGENIKSVRYWLRPTWGWSLTNELIVSDQSRIKVGEGEFRRFGSALELAALWNDPVPITSTR